MSISIVLCYSVVTCLCAGRSWLYTALNEQSVESYIRMFAENQDIVEGFYLRYQLYYAPVLCSGTPLIWIPMGQKKVSVLVRCPYFMVQRTVVGERKVRGVLISGVSLERGSTVMDVFLCELMFWHRLQKFAFVKDITSLIL